MNKMNRSSVIRKKENAENLIFLQTFGKNRNKERH